jgi:hypothetical protein
MFACDLLRNSASALKSAVLIARDSLYLRSPQSRTSERVWEADARTLVDAVELRIGSCSPAPDLIKC